MSLRDFLCGASHALCHCEIFCGAVSRIVSLRDFLRSGLTIFVVARLFVRSDLTRCVVARFFYIPF